MNHFFSKRMKQISEITRDLGNFNYAVFHHRSVTESVYCTSKSLSENTKQKWKGLIEETIPFYVLNGLETDRYSSSSSTFDRAMLLDVMTTYKKHRHYEIPLGEFALPELGLAELSNILVREQPNIVENVTVVIDLNACGSIDYGEGQGLEPMNVDLYYLIYNKRGEPRFLYSWEYYKVSMNDLELEISESLLSNGLKRHRRSLAA